MLTVDSPDPSRPSFTSVEPSPTSSHFPIARSDESGSPPPTTKTSLSGSDNPLPDIPRISATAFTSILGALLTDQSSFVAKATEAALVRFLCRLKDKPIPPPDSPEEPAIAEFAFQSSLTTSPQVEPLPLKTDESHHEGYEFLPEAKQLLEDEVVSGIVLGLARLEEDDKSTAEGSIPALDSPQTQRVVALSDAPPPPALPSSTSSPLPPQVSKEEVENPQLFLSPEEEPLSDEWLSGLDSSAEQDVTAGPSMDSWGSQLVASTVNSSSSSSSVMDDEENGSVPSNLLQSLSSPLGEPMYSSFSPDHAAEDADEEASIGKMVSMSLIGAISSAECLEHSVLVEQFLPEVERMKEEPMFYVRKEAVQALGSLAKALPVEALEVAAVRSLFSSVPPRTELTSLPIARAPRRFQPRPSLARS